MNTGSAPYASPQETSEKMPTGFPAISTCALAPVIVFAIFPIVLFLFGDYRLRPSRLGDLRNQERDRDEVQCASELDLDGHLHHGASDLDEGVTESLFGTSRRSNQLEP